MNSVLPRSANLRWFTSCAGLALWLFLVGRAEGETCFTANDMDPAARSALATSGQRYYDLVARGDSATLRQAAIPAVASDFSGFEATVKDNQPAFVGAKGAPRPPFLLDAQGTAPIPHAEFFCGVFGSRGQTADSAVFYLNNLPPGKYGIVIFDVPSSKGAHTVSFILQQQGNDWKLGDLYIKSSQIAGHDLNWFITHAHDLKAKGQVHNAWFYYLEARNLISPLDFMSTQATDKLYDESQSAQPTDVPSEGKTVDLAAAGITYKLISIFPEAVGNDLDLIVKYQAANISNTGQTFQTNLAVIKALVTKYPEVRDAFAAVVARAVDPAGRDYGTLLAMKDIK
jgi:hypothetical protein